MNTLMGEAGNTLSEHRIASCDCGQALGLIERNINTHHLPQ
jgi:hypothetical protein